MQNPNSQVLLKVMLPVLPPEAERLSIKVDTIRNLVVPYEYEEMRDFIAGNLNAMMQQWVVEVFGVAARVNPAMRPGKFTVHLTRETGEHYGTFSADVASVQEVGS